MLNIKLKLALAFIISLAAIGTAVYFAYTSFKNLEHSVYTLSQPDNTVSLLNDINNKLIASENEMRSYSLTEDEISLDNYIQYMSEISSHLDTLKKYPAFSMLDTIKLDTLKDLLEDKAELMYALVEMKNDKGGQNIAKKAMKEISKSANTAQELQEKVKEEYTDSIQSIGPGIKKSSMPAENTDKESFFNRIFNKKEKRKKNEQEETITEIPADSVTSETQLITPSEASILASNPEVDPEELRNIMTELNRNEQNYEQRLSQQELEILTTDKVIREQIQEVINHAEKLQKKKIETNAASASNKAKASSQIMFGISLLALFAGIVFLAVIISDVNKSNRYKLELELAKDNAEYHAKAKELFLANMSHEIRTPLNAIIGFSEQLKYTKLETNQDEYVQAVESASEHLLNIVNDILDLTKIEAGKINLQKNIFSMSDVVAEVAHIMQVKANEKGIGLEFFYDDMSKQLVRGDDFRLKQVLYNLIGNAIKFTHKGFVKITCNSEHKDPHIYFTIDIKDSGIGISKEKIDSIFQDFSQADTSTTKKYGGTGLGLSISKKLIELQQGEILVSSKEAEGSTFTIKIRYRIPSDKQIAAFLAESEADHIIPKNISVLLVDDEPFNLSLASVIFRKNGIQHSCVASAKEAMQIFTHEKFHIVFADIHMPEEDGFSFAKKLRAIHPHIPLVALTANVMHEERQLLSASGFNDILTKPYKEQQLIDKIIAWTQNNTVETIKEEKLVIQQPELQEEKTETLPAAVIENGALYSLDEIELFTAGDEQLMVSVIHSFVESNKQNLMSMTQFAASDDIKGVNNIAHKMLPGFNHFKVYTLVPLLKKWEVAERINSDELFSDIECIKNSCLKLFADLEEEKRKLEEKLPV